MESASEKEFDDLTKIESKLETLKASLTKEGIPCETHLLIRGLSPGEDIVEFAKDKNIDQIFIGIEKKSKVGKLFFGSNAQHIILEAPCPVVSVNKNIF
jgi:Universal stress protein UspA and related nucleotide-binding proteins